jgi:hypothetical protein
MEIWGGKLDGCRQGYSSGVGTNMDKTGKLSLTSIYIKPHHPIDHLSLSKFIDSPSAYRFDEFNNIETAKTQITLAMAAIEKMIRREAGSRTCKRK